MSAAGIIFSNLHDRNIAELTGTRTMASIPFMCRYRFVDFPLSNMVHAGITDIKVITHYNYHSLMEHIGSGKDWDLALHSGGIKILPPYITAYANNVNTLYNSRMEALKSETNPLKWTKRAYFVLTNSDIICNMDLNDVINTHIKTGADITLVAKHIDFTSRESHNGVMIEADENGCLTNMIIHPKNHTGYNYINMNVMVMSRKFLNSMLLEAIAHNYTSFNRDIIMKNKDIMDFRIYEYNGFVASMSSFKEYFSASMDILNNQQYMEELFNVPGRAIFTKVHNSAPTSYSTTASASNSLIADNCTIQGTVENCILFRGVKVSRNAVVRNSILFQDTYVGENASVDFTVADKRVVFRDGGKTAGTKENPVYVDKGTMI